MFFSIIVATYNDLERLKLLLNDLDMQEGKYFELLVSIGKSDDGTKEFLTTRDFDFPIQVIDGSDTGIYDALNKLLPYINGKYTLCLGADERLLNPIFFSSLFSEMKNFKLAFYYTDLYIGKVDDYRTKFYPSVEEFQKRYNGLAHVHHQSALIPSEFFQQFQFDTLFETHADLDLMLAAQRRYELKKINKVGVLFAHGGKSGKKQHALRNFLEVMSIRRKNGLTPFNLRTLFSFLKMVLR